VLTIRGGETHFQDENIDFNEVFFDGENDPDSKSILELKNHSSITVREKILVDMPAKQAVISGNGYIKNISDNLEIDILNPYRDEVNPSRLIIESGIRIIDNVNLVKTGSGALHLNGAYNFAHEFGNLDIKKGLFVLGSANISVTGPITVGPDATFLIQYYSFEQLKLQRIAKQGGELTDLKLRGDTNKEAHLGFIKTTSAGSAIQGFNSLTIENNATIDFGNKAAETPLILYIDQLIFDTPESLLRIHEWIDGSSYLLVKKDWGDARISELLSKIYFYGYGWAKTWEAHDLEGFDDYWAIRPYATPEPATYGAILGTLGLGLVAWRKRRWAAHNQPSQ